MAKKTIANLAINLSAGTATLMQNFERATGIVRKFGRNVQSTSGLISGAMSGLVANVAALAGVGSLGGAAGWGLKLAADAETAQIAFEVMFGSAEKAKQTLAELKEFGKRTPFEFAGLRDSAKTLAAFGIAQQDLLPTLKMLGDVAAGDQAKLNQLSLVYGQISSAGRLMGQDLLQLIAVGFNPLQKMSERTGESMLSLKKKMEAGQISFDMVRQEFERATSAGGMFAGMTERMGTTLAGRWSTLKDEVAELALTFGEVLMPAASRLLDGITQLVTWLGSLDAIMVGNTVKIVAFAASFVTVLIMIPKIVAAFRMIVVGLRAIATAQAIVMALSGGWKQLAIAAVTAAASVAAIVIAFEAITDTADAATAAAADAAVEIKEISPKPLKDVSEAATLTAAELKSAAAAAEKFWDAFDSGSKSLTDAQAAAKRLTEEMETPGEKLTRQLKELQGLWDQRLITEDVFNRGNEKVRADYDAAMKSAQEIEAVQKRLEGVAAIQQGSAADMAALDAVRRQILDQRDLGAAVAQTKKQTEEVGAAATSAATQAAEVVDAAAAAAAGFENLRMPDFGAAVPAIAGMARRLDEIQPPGVLPGLEARAAGARHEPFEEPIEPPKPPIPPQYAPQANAVRDAGQQYREMVREQQRLAAAQEAGNKYLADIAVNTKEQKIKVTEATI